MATVTGLVVDFTGQPHPELHPVLIFEPVVVASRDNAVFFRRRIRVTPDATGAFSIALIDSTTTHPMSGYRVSVVWLMAAGSDIPTLPDYFDNVLIVPPEGGDIADLLQLPTSSAMTFTGTVSPANPTPGTWWLYADPADPADPLNGNLYEWEN
jgi:hypothetical protein